MTAEAPWRDAVVAVWRRAQRISAVGPGDVTIHLSHAEAISDRIDAAAMSGLDLGSGAGIPGLALAGLRPSMAWVLLDAAGRRTRFLEAAVRELGWEDRVTVVHERAETLPRRDGMARRFDVVVARLFGPPAVTAECAAPLVRRNGQVLVTEPPSGDEQAGPARWDGGGLAVLGLRLGSRSVDPVVQELRADGEPEARFPRKPGVPVKRPLW